MMAYVINWYSTGEYPAEYTRTFKTREERDEFRKRIDRPGAHVTTWESE